MTARLHVLSWLTLAVFVQFAVIAGDPARARAASNPILSRSVTKGGTTTTFTGSTEGGNLVLTSQDPQGLRVVIPESAIEGLKAIEVANEVYVLNPGDGDAASDSALRVTAGGQSGPEEGQITYSGTAEDGGSTLEYKAVVSDIGTRLPAVAVVVIVVVSVGAVLCLGALGIQAAATNCAKDCSAKCGGDVAECNTDTITGVKYSKEKGVEVGCTVHCVSKCNTMPVSMIPSLLAPPTDPIAEILAPSCS